MKISRLVIFLICSILVSAAYGQKIKLDSTNLFSNNVQVEIGKFFGKNVIKVVKDSTIKEADEPTFARVQNTKFKNGIIEIDVLSRLLPTASPTDRGFIGLAFRIDDTNSNFECIYIRPTNGRASDQIRRNHSIQYFSYPDFKFDRLRRESAEKYESYSDMGLNEWIKMKITVHDKQAKLFLNNSEEPSLIVNDLKHGGELAGAVGLFVDVGTEGYFRNLKITLLD